MLQRPSLSPQFRYCSPAIDLLVVARGARQILDGDSKTRVFDLEIAMTVVVIVRQQPFFQCWLQVRMAASATQPNFEYSKDNERVPRVNVASRPLSKRSGQVDGFSVLTALTALERQSIKIGPSSEVEMRAAMQAKIKVVERIEMREVRSSTASVVARQWLHGKKRAKAV